MASKPVCDICLRRDKTSVAKRFCSDCEDKLCTECTDVHGMFKAFVSHHVVDINLATDQSFEIKKFCSKHLEMILEIYCSDHDELCCRSCMTDEHRTCEKLLPLEVAAKDIRKSVIFGDTSAEVKQLYKTADRLADVKGEFSSILDGSKVGVQKKISDLKEKLLERVNQIESRCLLEVDIVYAKLSSEVQDYENRVESRISAIQDISRRFELVTKYGSENQIFLLLNSIKSDINKTSVDLEGFVPTLKCPAIAFDEGDLVHSMKSLGLVTEKESACNIEYRPLQNQQAQTIQTQERVLTKFQLEDKVSLKSDGISGVSITRHNSIVLCQRNCLNLLVLTEKGQHLGNITLSSRPWGIARIVIPPDSDEAWVTLPDEKYMQVVDTRNYVPTRQVMVRESGNFGIAVIGENIAVGNRGKVDVINKNGVLLNSLEIGEGILYSLCAGRNNTNKLYCCETDRGNLHCINMDGTVVFTLSSLKCPIGVVTDGRGNMYVFNNAMHRFSEDGKLMDIILTKKDGLNSPYSGIFNNNCTKMFVANWLDGNMFILSCK